MVGGAILALVVGAATYIATGDPLRAFICGVSMFGLTLGVYVFGEVLGVPFAADVLYGIQIALAGYCPQQG